MTRKLTTLRFCLALVAGLVGVLPAAAAAPVVPLTAISLTGGTYAQDFDTLASSGTGSVLPPGWAFSESGTGANTTYSTGTGSNNAGNTYSFGSESSSERAFGGLQSSALVPTLGAELQNNTGGIITGLAVSYDCEQWRLGAPDRADQMDFQISTDATSLTTGTWILVDSLDCISAVTSGATGAMNGNSSANRSAVSDTLTGLSIPNTAIFWLRWTDLDVTGADDGLAVDDFSIAPAAPSAVTLADFYAEQVADYVLLTWETNSELNNRGFNLYRGTSAAGPDRQLNETLIPSQSQGGPGGFVYTWEDRADLAPGTAYFYWVEDVDTAGVATMHGPVSVDYTGPTAVTLSSLEAATAFRQGIRVLEFLRSLWYTRLGNAGVAGVLR